MALTRETILEIARSLPPGARVFSKLGVLLRDESSELEDIAALIKRDAAMAAHVIRMSNSVAYRGEQPTASVEEALARIGLPEKTFRAAGMQARAALDAFQRRLAKTGPDGEMENGKPEKIAAPPPE